jgi:hypothetical protein
LRSETIPADYWIDISGTVAYYVKEFYKKEKERTDEKSNVDLPSAGV